MGFIISTRKHRLEKGQMLDMQNLVRHLSHAASCRGGPRSRGFLTKHLSVMAIPWPLKANWTFHMRQHELLLLTLTALGKLQVWSQTGQLSGLSSPRRDVQLRKRFCLKGMRWSGRWGSPFRHHVNYKRRAAPHGRCPRHTLCSRLWAASVKPMLNPRFTEEPCSKCKSPGVLQNLTRSVSILCPFQFRSSLGSSKDTAAM